jgi:hypothetical protein
MGIWKVFFGFFQLPPVWAAFFSGARVHVQKLKDPLQWFGALLLISFWWCAAAFRLTKAPDSIGGVLPLTRVLLLLALGYVADTLLSGALSFWIMVLWLLWFCAWELHHWNRFRIVIAVLASLVALDLVLGEVLAVLATSYARPIAQLVLDLLLPFALYSSVRVHSFTKGIAKRSRKSVRVSRFVGVFLLMLGVVGWLDLNAYATKHDQRYPSFQELAPVVQDIPDEENMVAALVQFPQEFAWLFPTDPEIALGMTEDEESIWALMVNGGTNLRPDSEYIKFRNPLWDAAKAASERPGYEIRDLEGAGQWDAERVAATPVEMNTRALRVSRGLMIRGIAEWEVGSTRAALADIAAAERIARKALNGKEGFRSANAAIAVHGAAIEWLQTIWTSGRLNRFEELRLGSYLQIKTDARSALLEGVRTDYWRTQAQVLLISRGKLEEAQHPTTGLLYERLGRSLRGKILWSSSWLLQPGLTTNLLNVQYAERSDRISRSCTHLDDDQVSFNQRGFAEELMRFTRPNALGEDIIQFTARTRYSMIRRCQYEQLMAE